MGRNAKLSAEALPEGEERLLEDGVFPFSFGVPWTQGEPPARGIDLEEDLRLHKAGGEDVVGRRAQLCHDLLRWYQAIGTPYGYYLFQALQAQSRLLQSCCLRITTHYPSFEFEIPIYPWFTANTKTWVEQVKAGDDEGGPLKVLVKSLRTWTSLDRAIGVLAGTTPLDLRVVRNPIVLMDKWLGGTQEFAVAMPQGVSPDEPACPVDAGLPMGGNAVMSGAAKAAGFLYVMRFERGAVAGGTEVDVAAHYRASQFEVRTMAAFGEALAGRRPQSEGALLTFLAASDLALFPPLHPMFASLRDGVRWSDLHPGFRLRRIFEVIKDRDLKLDSVDPWAYWRFASAICQALKWPEVTRILDAVRARE
jgi:hypothetical protein